MSTEITIQQDQIDINVDTTTIVIESPTGGYPLPSSVYSVFGRVGNVIAQDGDYNLTQLGDVTISNPLTGQALVYNGTAWVNNTETYVGTVTSVNMSVPTGLTISGNPITTAGTLALGLASGYSIPTTASQSTWDTAYSRSLTSAAVTGTTTKTLTLNEQGGGTITATWSDYDTAPVTSVFGRTGAITAQSGDYNTLQVTENTNLYFTDQRARYAISGDSNSGVVYSNTTGIIALDDIPNTSLLHDSVTVNGSTVALGGSTSFTTSSVAEGTNLYYTQARFNTAFAAKSTTDLAEGTNLYFTTARAQAAISGTSPISVTSGVVSISQANGSTNGYLSSTDWNTFNSKQGTLTLTTTGSSGSATLVGSTLNVPTYTLSGLGGIGYTDLSASSPLSYNNITGAFSIQVANASQNGYLSSADWSTFNAKQAALNGTGFVKISGTTISYDNSTYLTTIEGITAGGELSGTYTSPSLVNSAVTGKVLTGVNITGGTIQATDSILTAFGKVQNQINGLIGGSIYKGTWNASTNTPTLASGVGTTGWYYIVNVAGSTNLDGITDWNVGDWAIFDGTAWQQVDNTDAVVSVNGFTGAVSLTTSNISEGTNLYYTDARARGSVSGGTGISYNSSTGVITNTITQYTDSNARAALSFTAGSGAYNSTTGVITIPTNNNQITNGAGYITTADLTGLVPYTGATGAVNLGAYDLTVNGLTIGKGNSSLSNNTALGYQTLYHATTGNNNTAVGYQAGHNITTGTYNVSIGQSAMFTNTTGGQNTAIGVNALLSNTTGGSNVVVGLDALQHNTTGSSNTALGYNAGSHITGGSTPNTTASSSVYIGRDSKALADGGVNEIVIGYNAVGNGSNTTTFGNTSTTSNHFTGSVNAGSFVKSGGTSSEFLKANGSVDSTSYQPLITAGTTSQYYRGDKTFQTLDTSVVPENTNLYYTDARSRSAISLTTTGSSGASTYNSTTGVLNVPTYTLAGLGGINLTSLSATSPLAYNNTTGVFSIQQANGTQAGYLSSADWTTFNNKASTASLANYLPLAGGTLTGALNGTTATFSGGVTATGVGLNPSFKLTNTTGTTGVDWHLYSLNNGNFGIYNNTAGAYSLQIASTGAATFSSSVTSGTYLATQSGNELRLYNGSNNSYSQIYNSAASGSSNIVLTTNTGIDYQVRSTNGASGNHTFKSYNTAILTLDGGTNAATFASSVSATQGIFSENSGNVILQALKTGATNATTAIIRQTGAGGNGDQNIGLLVDIQGANDDDRIANFRYYNGSTYTSRMLVKRNGNVGINTDTPINKLQVHSAGSATDECAIRLRNPSGAFAPATTGIYFQGGYTSDKEGVAAIMGGRQTAANDSYLTFWTNPSGTTIYERMRITSGGGVCIGTNSSGSTTRLRVIDSTGSQGGILGEFSNAAFLTTYFYTVNSDNWNAAGTAMALGRNSSTGRSINAGGTINASGADYAEYMLKAIYETINKGDIVGVNEDGKLTNIFADAKSFVVKSTNPSYVGGDTWGSVDEIGKMPENPTDEEKGEYEIKLEAARQKVDRVAFSGQVPCNVLNAQVGDYIIPINDNGKISGQAVTNPTFEQYQISVGKVWKIMEDGRAWIAVKIG